MIAINKKTILSDLHDRIEVVRNNMQPFLKLRTQQLHWKPAPDKWCIAEIFEHINITHGIYLKYINTALANAPIQARETFKSNLLGIWSYDLIMPRQDGSVFKLRAPKFLHANPVNLDGEQVLSSFMKQLDDFDHILELAQYVDLQKIKIPFSFTSLLKLRMGDNLRFIVAHNERHLLQAQKVLAILPTE
jgi:DinB superfamily